MGGRRGARRSEPSLPVARRARPRARALLLRRPDLAGDRVWRRAGAQREPGRPAARRVLRRARLAGARALRHRRRVVRPSLPVRGHGAGRRRAADRAGRVRDADELRGVPGGASADVGGHGPREDVVELYTRRRALAGGLRLSHRRRHPAALAGTPPRGARLAPRSRRPLLRSARVGALEGPVGGARRLRRRRPGSVARAAGRVPGPPSACGTGSAGAARGAPAARARAQPHAHVHLVRLVLRRDLGDRAGADPPVHRDGAPVSPRSRRRRPRAGIRPPARGGAGQRPGVRERRRGVPPARPPRRRRPASGRRPLRDHGPLRGAARGLPALRLPHGEARRGARVLRRHHRAHRSRPGRVRDHR